MKSFFSLSSFSILAGFLLYSGIVAGQTQPVPFDLSSGNYTFSAWDSLNSPGTFPANMIFQFVPSNRTSVVYNDSASDYSCPYNLSKRPRIIGYMGQGIGFQTTSSSQYNDCSSGAADKRFMGSALLSLKTLNRSNIRVSWKSETLIPGDGNGTPETPRIWNLRLQYRIGTSGDFTDVPGPVEFIASTVSGDSLTLGPNVIPAECNNKAVVQLRWLYFESSPGSGGTRPRLRLDDIFVNSESSVGMVDYSTPSFSIVPNPASTSFVLKDIPFMEGRLRVLDFSGLMVMETKFNDRNPSVDCSSLHSGLYLVQLSDALTGKIATSELIIR